MRRRWAQQVDDMNLRIGIISYHAARISSSSSPQHLGNINGEIVTLYGYVCRSFLAANWIKVVVAVVGITPQQQTTPTSDVY